MASIIGNRDHVSRAELAQFVVDQFVLVRALASSGRRAWAHPALPSQIMGAGPWPDPEWRLGEAPNAYNTENTCLAFLWSPAPGVWQPAFRVRNQHCGVRREPSVS
jgi:hypothetical protein